LFLLAKSYFCTRTQTTSCTSQGCFITPSASCIGNLPTVIKPGGAQQVIDASQVGKWIALAGIGLVLAGALIWLAGQWGLPLGRLPGDIHVERKRFSFQFPLGTCIVLSILLTLAINLIVWLFKR
jgi:hypothetical protein